MNYAQLPHHHIIRIQGEQAVKFVDELACNKLNSDGQPIFAAILDLKGAIIAHFFAYGCANDVSLQTATPQALGKWLARYKLGSNLTIRQTSQAIFVVWGSKIADHKKRNQDRIKLPEDLFWFQDPRGDFGIYYSVGKVDVCQKWLENQRDFKQKTLADWQYYRISLGLSDDEYQDHSLLPLNLHADALHGISWDKGCYPGQEICARIHFKGQVKKKVFPFQLESGNGEFANIINTDIYAGQQQNVGKIIAQTGNVGLALIGSKHIDDLLHTGQKLLLQVKLPEWLQKCNL